MISPRRIAIYGKGGIGKSTVAVNLALLWSGAGQRVLVIGCDPKGDVGRLLRPGAFDPPVLDLLRSQGPEALLLDQVVLPGLGGVDLVEAGGPEPGVGCAGRGVLTTFDVLASLGLPGDRYDIILYDVLGDVVCGGFAMPLRRGQAQEALIVTSGEAMSLYAANNISHALSRTARSGGGKLLALVGNAREAPGSDDATREGTMIGRLAGALGVPLAGLVPRDPAFRHAEKARLPLVMHAPQSPAALAMAALARWLDEAGPARAPTPLDRQALEELLGRP